MRLALLASAGCAVAVAGSVSPRVPGVGAAAAIDAGCPLHSSCTAAYSSLRTAGEITAFGLYSDAMPLAGSTLLQEQILPLSGLPPTAFAPRPRSSPRPSGGQRWPATLDAAAGLVSTQLILASGALSDELTLGGLRPGSVPELGLLNLITLVLGILLGSTTLFAIIDRTLLSEKLLATLRLLDRRRRGDVLRHEAGHFLCAYLLGVPVQACELSPRLATLLRPSAAPLGETVFISPAVSALSAGQRAEPEDVRRLAVVLMGGIAAEALSQGHADGGAADEAALRALFAAVARRGAVDAASPDGSSGGGAEEATVEASARACARWAAVSATLLVREQRAAYDALCDALHDNCSVGECVLAIERSVVTPGSSGTGTRTGAATPDLDQGASVGTSAPAQGVGVGVDVGVDVAWDVGVAATSATTSL
jgi:hypothetical protein